MSGIVVRCFTKLSRACARAAVPEGADPDLSRRNWMPPKTSITLARQDPRTTGGTGRRSGGVTASRHGPAPSAASSSFPEEDPVLPRLTGSSELVQESDVLDTWFVRPVALFSTMGRLDKTKVILPRSIPHPCSSPSGHPCAFWVARMMMRMGCTSWIRCLQVQVYLHALVTRRRAARCPNPPAATLYRPGLVMIE